MSHLEEKKYLNIIDLHLNKGVFLARYEFQL